MENRELISCICMTCGVRNDHSHPQGLCQNDHDDWLEYRDVEFENKWFKKACSIFDLTPDEMREKFLDKSILHIEVINHA